jgi:TPR repeat protein
MFHLGALHLRGEVPGIAKDPAKAFYHFTGAAHAGHATAAYNLAMMQLGGSAPGNGAAQLNCRNAANLLKGIAERGRWNAPVERANEAFREGNLDAAYALYAKAAEAGLEVAQANAAHVLETLARRAGTEAERDERLALALRFHKLAADQGNARSLLKVGDAMYYGRGVERDVEAAARVYLRASRQRSAQAMFNLGAAHEHGVGLPKDLHLAKRYYDMVLSTNPKAFLPVRLALWKLAAHAKVVETLERWGWIASASAGAGAGTGPRRGRATRTARGREGASRRAPARVGRGLGFGSGSGEARGISSRRSDTRTSRSRGGWGWRSAPSSRRGSSSRRSTRRGREPTAGRRRASERLRDERRSSVRFRFTRGAFFFSPLESRGGDERS